MADPGLRDSAAALLAVSMAPPLYDTLAMEVAAAGSAPTSSMSLPTAEIPESQGGDGVHWDAEREELVADRADDHSQVTIERALPPGPVTAQVRAATVEKLQPEGLTWSIKADRWLDWMQSVECECGAKERVHCCPLSMGKGEVEFELHVYAMLAILKANGILGIAERSVGC